MALSPQWEGYISLEVKRWQMEWAHFPLLLMTPLGDFAFLISAPLGWSPGHQRGEHSLQRTQKVPIEPQAKAVIGLLLSMDQ